MDLVDLYEQLVFFTDCDARLGFRDQCIRLLVGEGVRPSVQAALI